MNCKKLFRNIKALCLLFSVLAIYLFSAVPVYGTYGLETAELLKVRNIVNSNIGNNVESIPYFSDEKANENLIPDIQTEEIIIKEIIPAWAENIPEYINLSQERKDILKYAHSLIGEIPYTWGAYATSPGLEGINFRKGLDCSHFVDWVYWTAIGDDLGNGSTATLSTGGKFVKISASELEPGDLGFRWTGGSISKRKANHVGIYTGDEDGQWIHCAGNVGVIKNNYSGFKVFYRYVEF